MENLINLFLEKNRNKQLTIYCVGDSVLDEYYEVSVDRISPEFPMSVMQSPDGDPVVRPGGAANVVAQYKHFNVDHLLFSFADQYLYQAGIRDGCCPSLSLIGGRVPVKRRFLDHGIQVTRWDVEKPNCGLDDEKVSEYRSHVQFGLTDVPTPDVMIFSDYGKGLFDEGTNWITPHKDVITIVDPKSGPLKRWAGCTIFKPNAKEAKELSGSDDWRSQSIVFQAELGCQAVVITHSGKRVVGRWRDEFFEYTPEKAVSVRSSVGAGDCFVAFLAMAVGHGFSGVEAVEIAYEAGAKYVQGLLNRPITPAELSPSKIVHPEDLANRDFKLVFANGCFDILHSAHLQTLRFAASKGDKLVVALNSDDSVKRLKGPSRPVKPLCERLVVMAGMEMVDFVTWFEEDTPLEVIQKIKPDVLVKGAQYGDGEIVGEDIVPETYRAPMIEGISTTQLLTSRLCPDS